MNGHDGLHFQAGCPGFDAVGHLALSHRFLIAPAAVGSPGKSQSGGVIPEKKRVLESHTESLRAQRNNFIRVVTTPDFGRKRRNFLDLPERNDGLKLKST
jgi:hypothetical protein